MDRAELIHQAANLAIEYIHNATIHMSSYMDDLMKKDSEAAIRESTIDLLTQATEDAESESEMR